MWNIEELKRVNLADFLTEHYGMAFRVAGSSFCAFSPFCEETKPSFFVWFDDGHWLFKDFAAQLSGTIIDFVLRKENLADVSSALRRLGRMLSGAASCSDSSPLPPAAKPAYDIASLYERFQAEDASFCRRYLLDRGIAAGLVEELLDRRIVVPNVYQGRSYCCFAVFDAQGALRCLDNHAVDGSDKFVLGAKHPFSLEWDALAQAEDVFLCEGIIDYLSVKTLERALRCGLALLGNQLNFDPALLAGAKRIVAAFDDDRGGYSALLDVQEQFADRCVERYELEGCKDPNELLQTVRAGKRSNLTPQRKLELYEEFVRSDNKVELARCWGVDRSYLYEIVKECQQAVVERWAERRPGRKPAGQPKTLAEALRLLEEAEERYEKEAFERETLYCRSEFLALRLKYAQIDAAEARQEKPAARPQVKKKEEKEETLKTVDRLDEECRRMNGGQIVGQCAYSASQLAQWRQRAERKPREAQWPGAETVQNAANVILDYPHFGGVKGQAYMNYHGLGFIGQKRYDELKTMLGATINREVSERNLLPDKAEYEHVKADRPGQIWAEDFTDLPVEGTRFRVAMLIDVYDQYILGYACGRRATAALAEKSVEQALALSDGRGPEQFLLSDNGTQYVGERHSFFLDAKEIVQRRIPGCSPQYNGSVECGNKEMKNVFYNRFELRRKLQTDEEKSLDRQVQAALSDAVFELNRQIPRPALQGRTPADVQFGDSKSAQEERLNNETRNQPAVTNETPITRKPWQIVQNAVKEAGMSAKETLTKWAFFKRKPLKIISRLNMEGVG